MQETQSDNKHLGSTVAKLPPLHLWRSVEMYFDERTQRLMFVFFLPCGLLCLHTERERERQFDAKQTWISCYRSHARCRRGREKKRTHSRPGVEHVQGRLEKPEAENVGVRERTGQAADYLTQSMCLWSPDIICRRRSVWSSNGARAISALATEHSPAARTFFNSMFLYIIDFRWIETITWWEKVG